MSDRIPKSEIETHLKRIPEWEVENDALERAFEFDDFTQAMDFVNGVAEIAEEAEHHPDIDIRWNKVRLMLSTHSQGGITENDFSLAERIDMLTD